MERRGDGVSIISRETSELSGRDAQFRAIDDSELCLTLPAAEVQADPATVVVTVRSGGSPLTGADVLALFPNNTWKRSRTDRQRRDGGLLVHIPKTLIFAKDDSHADDIVQIVREEFGLGNEASGGSNRCCESPAQPA